MAVKLYDEMIKSNATNTTTTLPQLDKDLYRDSDIPSKLPEDLKFSP